MHGKGRTAFRTLFSPAWAAAATPSALSITLFRASGGSAHRPVRPPEEASTRKETAATIGTGRLGIFHGMKSYFCQDEYGQIAPVYSISAGLDYPGIGPEHARLHDTGRAEYVPVTDDEAVDAFEYLSSTGGHHSRHRDRPRRCLRPGAGSYHEKRPDHCHQYLRQRRQGLWQPSHATEGRIFMSNISKSI